MALFKAVFTSSSYALLNQLVGALVLFVVASFVVTALYRISSLHSLSGIPGPLLARISNLHLVYHSYKGDEAQYVHRLHQRYGPVVRIGYNSVDFTHVAALQAIYIDKGGFAKARYYSNFNIDGHATVFSNTDATQRALRAKAVLPLFSAAGVRSASHVFSTCVRKYIQCFKQRRRTGQVNVLDLARGFSLDSVSEYLFGVGYGGLDDYSEAQQKAYGKGAKANPRMSASAVVDSFILTGRFWYLNPWLYNLADRLDAIIYPDPALRKSIDMVDRFTDRVMETADTQFGEPAQISAFASYPVRLLRANFSRSEAHAQCKDIIFAATDTTGMNLATLCFMLASHPQDYEKLCAEIASASIRKDEDLQGLPFLNGVIREVLRLSMTNPCRIPREVPPSGWWYQDTYYPAGTVVSCSAFEMHFSDKIFENPHAFMPERWARPTSDMNRAMMAFGLGTRQCIARTMAMYQLQMATYALVKHDLLRGARTTQESIQLQEGFASKVIGGEIQLRWDQPEVCKTANGMPTV